MDLNNTTILSNYDMDLLKTAMGPIVCELLADVTVVWLMLNQDGKLWCERIGTGREFTGHVIPEHEAKTIIKLVAAWTLAECSESKPIFSTELPEAGISFQGSLPPMVTAPVFAIHKNCAAR